MAWSEAFSSSRASGAVSFGSVNCSPTLGGQPPVWLLARAVVEEALLEDLPPPEEQGALLGEVVGDRRHVGSRAIQFDQGFGLESGVGERLDGVENEPTGRGEEDAIVASVASLAASAMDHPWSAAQIRETLASPSACLMCQDDASGGLAGFVLGRRVDRDLVEIDLVAVAPERRRAGIGRALLEELIAAERDGGVREFRLELAADNAAALALYSAVGFVVVGRRARYYPDGEDALLLSWTAEDAEGEAGRDERRMD